MHHQLHPFKNPFKAFIAGFRSQWILSRLKYPSLTPHWEVIAEKCFTRSQKPEIPVGVAQSEIRPHYVCNYWILIAIFALETSLKWNPICLWKIYLLFTQGIAMLLVFCFRNKEYASMGCISIQFGTNTFRGCSINVTWDTEECACNNQ